MKELKNLGIWMDHSSAYLVDLEAIMIDSRIDSEFTNELKKSTLNKGVSVMHNKEQQMHESYYKELGNEILKYNHVLLFGPTDAKTELLNYLKEDSHFKDIKIDIEPADKMTDNEKNAFVRKYFEK